MKLTESQNTAIKNVTGYINERKDKYIDMIEMILYQSNIDPDLFPAFFENVIKYAPIA